jgi:hypothetical protein
MSEAALDAYVRFLSLSFGLKKYCCWLYFSLVHMLLAVYFTVCCSLLDEFILLALLFAGGGCAASYLMSSFCYYLFVS